MRLSLAIAAAFAVTAATAGETSRPLAAMGDLQPHPGKALGKRGSSALPAPARPAQVASSVSVTSCADDLSAGTLRKVINSADPGGTVDLSGLACSKITLLHGAIEVPWADLTIAGPGSTRLAIDGGGTDRVFKHTNMGGTLTLYGLRVQNGKVAADNAYGGCLYSLGSLVLDEVVVSSCQAIGQLRAIGGGVVAVKSLTAVGSTIADNLAQSLDETDADSVQAAGGGAYAVEGVTLVRSVVSGNQALAPKGLVFGGGVVAPIFHAKYSTISGNDASSAGTGDDPGVGGGVATSSKAFVFACTLEGNSADAGGALFSSDDYYSDVMTFAQTTVSGNIGRLGAAAISVAGAIAFENSTVAFNQSGALAPFALTLSGTVTAKSSILANNTPADVLATAIGGDHNLIKLAEASTVLPMDTKTADPKLQPLAFNGGPTRTHALGSGSPAINAGSNPFTWQRDQRGPTYRRVVGASADIGAVEFDADHIFGTSLEFPGG
jgi:hypothetical protein